MRDLLFTFNDLKPEEIVTLKEEDGVKTVIRLEKINDALDKSLESFSGFVKNVQEKQQVVVEKTKPKFSTSIEQATNELKMGIVNEDTTLLKELYKKVEAIAEKLGLPEEEVKELTVELSDSQYEFAQLAFDKLAMKKFNDIKACVEIAKGLGIEE